MSNQSKIEFDHLGIGDALKRLRLAVPPNQREYSWTDKEVGELLQDLTGAVQEGKSAYFLGTIVLTKNESGKLEVVDGQQRLATTTIILASMRDYLQSLGDALLVTSLEEFLFTIDRAAREKLPRLELNVDDNEYFRQRVILSPDSKLRKKAHATKPSHELIDAASILASKHLTELLQALNPNNRLELLNTWVNFIESSAQVIILTAPDDVNAYIMFETLNDRGIRTTQADLLKNYLFLKAGDKLLAAQQKWSLMRGTLEALGDDVVLTFLRHHAICQYGYMTDREVLESIRNKIKSKVQALEFLDSMSDAASDYVAIRTPEHVKWNEYGGRVREHLRMLSTLGVKPMRPLLLAVASRFNKQQAALAFKMFVCWSVRYLITGVHRSGKIEQALANAANLISTGKVSTARDLFNEMRHGVPDDATFQAVFAIARITNGVLARYLLRALELKRKRSAEPEWIPNDDVVINLEHILPINPGDGWGNFNSETAPAYHKRIGNLALLQASRNAVAGNSSFAEKKSHYQESTFLLTKEVAASKKWGPAEIEARQGHLAAMAVETWPASI